MKTVNKRFQRPGVWLLGFVFAGFFPGAFAGVHPILSAELACTDNGYVINYTATSWLTTGEPGSGNSQVDILVNGVLVESGSFVAPDYSFSGSTPVPAHIEPGMDFKIMAHAAGDWDDGSPGGQSHSIKFVMPAEPCEQAQGRFTGGGHQVRVDGVRVTRGLTIHCDLLLSNNLEINWNGNQFHMEEHLQTTQCSDSPDIVQFPPDAPLDTLVGVGAGRYNNVDGYTIEFTLVDAGEPGTMDEMAILIYHTASGDVVLEVPQQRLDGGNLQAHYDQPHR